MTFSFVQSMSNKIKWIEKKYVHLLCSFSSSGTALYSILNPLSVTLPSVVKSNVTEELSISSITESLVPLALFWDVWASKKKIVIYQNDVIKAEQGHT